MDISKRWVIAERLTPENAAALAEYPPVLRQILVNRGFTSAAAAADFLAARPPADTDPLTMKDMVRAVTRIAAAIRSDEMIAVYGDYDADGVTATALLTQALRRLGAKHVKEYIPNRFDEGYGLHIEALNGLKELGCSLVITVDCGVRAQPEVAHAHDIGIDMIITDHHHPGDEPPAAYALLNPKQAGCPYGEKNLAGVGVAYKLACALTEQLAPGMDTDLFLDLVALGTVADLVPLVGENRALVRRGLEQIRRHPRQGLHSLIGAARLTRERITTSEIGFGLGPRLNAAGRLDTALDALELLLCEDPALTGALAQRLDDQNRARQQLTRSMQALASEQIGDPNAPIMIVASEEFNPGVVGLIASRLVETYYRPVIVAHRGPDKIRASCRSIPEFHITNALDDCRDLFDHHGGHAAAAGFTLAPEHWDELVTRISHIAATQLAASDLRPTLHADLEIPWSVLDVALLNDLEMLQPTGFSNPQPVFVSRAVPVMSVKTVGSDANHLRLTVGDRSRPSIDGIGFRLGQWAVRLNARPFERVDLLYNFEWNEFNGRRLPQLNIRDLRFTADA